MAPVGHFLDDRFPGRWIGKRGTIEWPARSPDLSPLDFLLWGHLKTKCFATKPESIEDLRQGITAECRNIPPDVRNDIV